MNSKFEERLRYWLRQASDEASRGFCYDKDEAEMNENWANFEKMAIEDIDNFISKETNNYNSV